VRAEDRVLTPTGHLGVIVRLKRHGGWEFGRWQWGPWYAVVEHDDGTRHLYLERSLVAAEVWEDASAWPR
jgi:hypothetical protein